MIIKVRNLGIVEEARVDLGKDFIIFTGENNTGKTYLAHTLYQMLNLDHEKLPGDKQSSSALISESIGSLLKADLKELFAYDEETGASLFNETCIEIEVPETAVREKLSPRDFARKYLSAGTYIAPAERSAINIFSKELSLIKNRLFEGLLKSNSKANEKLDLLKSRVNRYPRTIRDNLEIAEDLANLKKKRSAFHYLAEELEQQILKGKIRVSPGGEVKYIPGDAQDVKLEIHLTGSLVKALSNIVFYLRHLAARGDWIVIDEPELNLHPDNQRMMARFFGRLVNEGFKVLISTHSDYIVREINNLIMLSQDHEKTDQLIHRYGYLKNQCLKPGQVEVLLFRREENGSPGVKARAIEVSETGFEIETIDKVVKDLNDSSQDIYFTLFD
jgi:hypothetical protein